MERLSGLDAAFLYLETPTSPMHVSSLAVLDPSDTPGWGFERVNALFAERLPLLPAFRRRLVEVPFELHHPIWVEDPSFDLSRHVHRIGLPTPGGAAELRELAAHLMSLPLDRSRPLWEIWVIEGLEGGHVAVLSKMHHAAIDGGSGAELTVATYDLSPEGREVAPEVTPWKPERVPSDAELLAYAARSLARQPLQGLKAIVHTIEAGLNLRRLGSEPDLVPPAMPFRTPATSLNRALTRSRSFTTASLSLPAVKAVKNAAGCTVNDVVLAVCAGALRLYLDDLDEHPDGALVAMVPMSVRTDEQKGTMGNQVASMFCALATDVDDPAERLARIVEGTRSAKEAQRAIGARTLQNWAEFAAPAVAARAARLYSRTRMADRHRPLFNLTISNVPGPPFPLWMAGARLIGLYPMGPIFDGGGLNITVMSYQDSLDFGLVACPDVVADVDAIGDDLQKSLDELAGSVGATT